MEIKGIQEAVEDFNNHGGKSIVMYDYNECEVWADRFLTDDEFTDYGNDTVIGLIARNQHTAEQDKGNITASHIERVVRAFEAKKHRYDESLWGVIDWG